MRVVHDLLTVIALSEQYPVGFLGPFNHLRCFRACCADKIVLNGEDITLLDSWEDYVALYREWDNGKHHDGVLKFVCICAKQMVKH